MDGEDGFGIIPVLFTFFAGTLDVVITIIVIVNGLGYEANPMYNWIRPDWLMFYGMIGFNLALGLILIPLIRKYKIQLATYAFGMTRLVIGAGSGILILTGLR